MEKKSTGHTVYQQIRRVSVLGILVAMVLATGAGLSLNLMQERRIRDDTLTAAVQAVSHTLTITDGSDTTRIMEYVDRTVHGISGIDLFAVYDTDGEPLYFCDITDTEDEAAALEPLAPDLMERLAAGNGETALLDNDRAPKGADHCAYAAVHRPDGSIKGYVMAGLYISSIRTTALRTLGVYLLIGAAALGVGAFLSLRLAQRIKSDLLGYEPDAFRDLFLRRMELLDALDEGLLAIDREEHIIYINRAAAEMLSFDKSTVIGKPLSEVYPQSTIPRVIHTEQPEYNISLESLHHVRILSDRMPVRRGGQIVGAVAIFRNRTEVANLARELTGVQHIVEAMRAYTHEFMNKLHVILGLLQLGEAQQAEDYVLQLTQTRALSVGRISQSIAEPSVAALLIGKSCRAAELGVRLTLDPESRLSAATHYLPASGMITVLGNLIENAFDAFSNAPSDTLHEIGVSVRESERGLIISVDDNACGMPEEIREHIFERGSTSKGEGHGTGLFLVKSIVDTYGGEIRVESTQGVGSSFIVTFRPPRTENT
ncbi:MAG TPA: GHKL domain-containing protein [Candidatus Gemmiger excrementigallinarum]|uniref:histidine kinase n=1 Tax=Candidatus Gemmiger excrementigallinarum TaxID=2838609 RepID=A0A9D2JA70_9FIRM|nr:GHKL domain-containing protein [Candidatus Gemmiger excrementigallinarum]